MPTREAEAIVLRQYALSEADRIVVFLTREHGSLRAVAQGARKMRSRLGACLEPLNHVRLQYFAKEGGDLGRIWQCEIIHSFLGKQPTLDRVYGFSYLAELTQELAPENSPNARLFRLLLAILQTGEQIGASPQLIRYFELWALKLNGWLPDYDSCSGCGICIKKMGFFAWPEAGESRCSRCAENRGIRVGAEAARLFHEALLLSPAQFAGRPLSDSAAYDLERLTQALIEWHLEKRLKSYAVLRRVLNGSGSQEIDRNTP